MLDATKQLITSAFKGLHFDPQNHIYTYKGERSKPVSNIVKEFEEKVDWTEKAGVVAAKRGVSIYEILGEWKSKADDSIIKGNAVHAYAETDVYNTEPESSEQIAIQKFFKDIPARYSIIAKELRMVHFIYGYAGTCDLLLYDNLTGQLIIVDYKTNGDLDKNFKGKKLLYPFNSLLDTPFHKYEIQLSLYQILIEQIGLRVQERWIVWVNGEDYYRKQARNFTDLLSACLKDKSLNIC